MITQSFTHITGKKQMFYQTEPNCNASNYALDSHLYIHMVGQKSEATDS